MSHVASVLDAGENVLERERELRERLANLNALRSDPARAALRDAITQYVDRARILGWPPERVIVSIKQIARESGVRPADRVMGATANLNAMDELLVAIVHWCIERYYWQRCD